MNHDWRMWAPRRQRRPDGDWRAWVFLGGRGSGKTRAGAEWVGALARFGSCGRFALIGPTFHDVREVMIEGQSGLRAQGDMRPTYEVSRKRLVWSNGAQAQCFSAEDPESLRGPQFDAAWCDELAYWSYPDETLATLSHALRLGARPRMMVSTTPRPIQALKALLKQKDVAVTRGATWDNARNLSPHFIAEMRARWTGSVRDRQELLGELVEDLEGALFTRPLIEAARTRAWPQLERVVVAVDPPASVGARADACGIVAAGTYVLDKQRYVVVLEDASVQGASPSAWARRVALLAEDVGASCIVAEGNNGGEMVRTLLMQEAPNMVVRLHYARHGKVARAEPVSLYYERGLIKHARAFPALEDEMCNFGLDGGVKSPDRLDALVWAVIELMSAWRPSVRAI